MSRSVLILSDLVLVVVLIMIFANGDLEKYPVILAPLVLAAFATCLVRHINYYSMTKKIY
jgi:hypothetical protein